ncbi:hypothetical protein OKW21_002307 [Catalinimonas alkaloidigena]|nr:hypothetical protein [Catalinimonas alkaloidigena]
MRSKEIYFPNHSTSNGRKIHPYGIMGQHMALNFPKLRHVLRTYHYIRV